MGGQGPPDGQHEAGGRRVGDVLPFLGDEGGDDGGLTAPVGHDGHDLGVGKHVGQVALDGVQGGPLERQDGQLLLLVQLVLDVGAVVHGDAVRQHVLDGDGILVGDAGADDRDLVLEALGRNAGQAVGLELDVGILVGLDGTQQDVGEVQDLLVGAVVGLQLVGLEHPGALQYVQGLGVGSAELVERLATIAHNIQGALVLIRVLDAVDELGDGVVLDLVDDEVPGVNLGRLRQVVHVVVADDALQGQGRLLDGVQRLDDLVEMVFHEVVGPGVLPVHFHPGEHQLEVGDELGLRRRQIGLDGRGVKVDVQAVDDGVFAGELVRGVVVAVDRVQHGRDGHAVDGGLHVTDVVSGGVGEAQDGDVVGVDAVGQHVVDAAQDDRGVVGHQVVLGQVQVVGRVDLDAPHGYGRHGDGVYQGSAGRFGLAGSFGF